MVMENPVGSHLFSYPPLETAAAECNLRCVTVHLGYFGAPSLKPLWLVGNAPWLEQLAELSRRRKQSQSSWDFTPLARDNEAGGRTGNRAELVESQQYPEAFCAA